MSNYPVKFGKYLLLERVNVGGMAEVFKAKTFGVAGFERILAIKRILPNLVEDDEFIRMFIDEARIAVQLNHTNIVQIYELGKHGEHYYIAMEYIPSRDLRAILDRMRSNGQLMPIAQAAYVCKKVCEGLDYAHKKRDPQGNPMNIIHRDVSPQNILVGFEGEVKVIDFGIAKAANRASKTQAGVLKGKFGYMSPEQVRGLPTDRRSDIFAVGVLLYEMLTGERLFIGESDFSTLERVRNAEVIPPTNFNKKISPQLEQIVLRTLAREVEDRYQWASDLAEELEPFLVEDKQVFNMKRLAAVLKETYAAEIALERQKMEEFLRVTADDAKPEKGSQTSSLLPLHPHETDPRTLPPDRASLEAPPQPPPRGHAAHAKITAEVDEDEEAAAGFGEDKTFVIEASAAGVALQNQVTDAPQAPVKSREGPSASSPSSSATKQAPRGGMQTSSASGSMPQPKIGHGAKQPEVSRSNTQPKPPSKPENTNDDFLEQVSLYGDDASEVDDSRTLVSAPNPFLNPGADNKTGEEDDDDEIDASEMNDSAPPQPAPVKPKPPMRDVVVHTNATKRPMTAEELSDAPTTAQTSDGRRAPPPPPAKEPPRAAPKPGSGAQQAAKGGAALDPVAAAMEEEERMALEVLRGTTGGRPDSKPAAPAPNAASRSNARAPGDFGGSGVPLSPSAAAPTRSIVDATMEQGEDLDIGVDDDAGDGAHLGAANDGMQGGMQGGMHDGAPPVVVQAIPPNMMRLLIAAMAASVFVFLVVAVVFVVKVVGGGKSTSQLVLYTTGEVAAPADLQVSVDDVVMPGGLAAPITLTKGPHKIRIKGSGIIPMTRTVRANGASMRQPVLLVAAEPDEKQPIEHAPPPTPSTPPTNAVNAAAGDDDKPVAPSFANGWRLTLAAVADDTGKPISGADVIINGTRYGRTPLEAEIDPALDKVTVRVKKDGYIARDVPIARNGRERVGPATVRLLSGGDKAASADDKPAPAAAATPDADKPEKVASADKAEKPEKADKPAAVEKTEKAEKAAVVDKKPPPEKSEKAEKVASAAAAEKPVEKAAPAEKKPAKVARGALQIYTSPSALKVYIDGTYVGDSILTGTHTPQVSIGTAHSVQLVDKQGNKRRFSVTVLEDSSDNRLVVDAKGSPLVRGRVKLN